jgi:hypothetical protein
LRQTICAAKQFDNFPGACTKFPFAFTCLTHHMWTARGISGLDGATPHPKCSSWMA